MASKFFVGNGTNWSSTSSWSTTTGGTSGAAVPVAGDDVIFDANSPGNCTIDVSTNTIRSLVMTGFTHTLTHAAAVTLNVGGGTAPVSNTALVFAGTYTISNATTSAIAITDTSAAINSYNFNGATLGNVTINNGTTTTTKLVTSGMTLGATATLTLTQGTLDFNGVTCSIGLLSSSNANTRALKLGASSITITGGLSAWNTAVTTGMTLTCGTSTLTFSGTNTTFNAGTFTYNNVSFTGSGLACMGGACTIANLTRTGTAVKTDGFGINANITVTTALVLSGNSATNRILVQSQSSNTGTPGVSVTITNNGTNTITNADFMDITGAGTASWDLHAITGLSGDCGGNSGITFTTPATQTWSGTSGGNWSANAWTTRVPLAQDNVIISSAFSANQTITGDMARLGATIDFTGSTGNPTFSPGTSLITGGLTLISGMNWTGAGSVTFGGRSAFNLDPQGHSTGNQVFINAPGGTYTLQSNYISTQNFILTQGGFNANGFNMTFNQFTCNSANARTLNMGSGTWSLTTTSATVAWIFSASGLAFTGSSATLLIQNASANSRTIQMAGQNFGTITYTVAASTGALVLTGGGTIGTLNFSDSTNARTLTFTHGTTTTIANAFNVNGTSGKLMTINSDLGASAATLSYTGPGVVNCVFLSIQDNTPTQTNTWFAGHNSTLVSNTGNWVAGVGNTQTLTASLAMSGNEPKQTNIPLTAGITFVGGIFKGWRHVLAANLGFSGSYSKQSNRPLAASVGFAGAFSKAGQRIMSAAVGFVGSQGKTITAQLAAALSFTGSLTEGKTYFKTFIATVGFTGNVGKRSTRIIAAALTFTGNFGRGFAKTLTAVLNLGSSGNTYNNPMGFGASGWGEVGFGQTGRLYASSGNLLIRFIKSKGLSFTGNLFMRLMPRPSFPLFLGTNGSTINISTNNSTTNISNNSDNINL